MGIRKVPNSNLVINNHIYTRQELADILKCTRQRIAAYIRDGLECCDEGCQEIWGKDLKLYAEKVRQRKVKAEADEFHCKHCKKPVKIANRKITVKEYPEQVNKSGFYKILVQGKCENCGCICVKFSWSNHLAELQNTFQIVEFLA